MWMSELAASAGLPVPTVKYYLRAGLLHPGEATGATRAQYDATHVRRLRLVRALTEVAGMRLDTVRQVLDAVDDEGLSWHEAVGSAHSRLGAEPFGEPSDPSLARVDALLAGREWSVHENSPHRVAMALALDALTALDHPPTDELLATYADAAASIARADVAGAADPDRVSAAEHVVVGTLLLEPVLLSLRRMAEEATSARLGGQGDVA